MPVLTADDIDFALYERETDAKRKVRPAAEWVQTSMSVTLIHTSIVSR
jgi:hypothetical protein